MGLHLLVVARVVEVVRGGPREVQVVHDVVQVLRGASLGGVPLGGVPLGEVLLGVVLLGVVLLGVVLPGVVLPGAGAGLGAGGDSFVDALTNPSLYNFKL